MVNYSDKQIIEAIRLGNNRDALKSLYLSVLPNVERHICKNSGSKEEAFDIFQDAVMVFYKHVQQNTFDEARYKIGGFLFTVSKNLWINYVNKKALGNKWTKQQKYETETDLNIEENIISEERKSLLDKLFQRLGDECTKILTFSIYQDLSAKEIADKIGSNENAVRVNAYRCRKKLREMVYENASLLKSLKN